MNIEGWTLGGIIAITSCLIVLISNLKKLSSEMTESIGKVVKKEMKPLEDKVDALSKKVDAVEMESTKNFIISTLGEIDRNNYTDEATKQRLYEEIEKYKGMGGNSYIQARFQQVQNKGYLN